MSNVIIENKEHNVQEGIKIYDVYVVYTIEDYEIKIITDFFRVF